MLQFELYSRNRRPADFLAKNRKAAKNFKLGTAPKVKREFVKSPVPMVKPTASQMNTESGTHVAPSYNGGGEGGGTVVISKDYLESLLKKSVMMQPEGRGGENVKRTQANCELQSLYCHHTGTGLASSANLNTHTVAANTYPQLDTQPLEKWRESTAQASLIPAGRTTGGRLKQGRRVSPPAEEYFPFGRPGCGAPLRTASGHVMADLRGGGYNPHNSYCPSLLPATTYGMTQGSEHLGQTNGAITGHSHIPDQASVPVEGVSSGNVEEWNPTYARGAGPHVNQYTLNEKAEKRKKELEHKAFLKEQILAKERSKRLAREKAEQEEKQEEIKFAREMQKQQDVYNRERERAARKEDASHQRQAMLREAIEKADARALSAKLASRTAVVAACTSPALSTPYPSLMHSHEPSHAAANTRGSRIPVHSKYLGSNQNNATSTALRSRQAAGKLPPQQHRHGAVHTVAQRREVGVATRKWQKSKMKPCHAMAAESNSTNSTASLGDTMCGVRGEECLGGTVSPPVPALARRMRKTGPHQHTITTPAHGKAVLTIHQDISHNNRTQVQMHHQNNGVANHSPHGPTEALSSMGAGRREMKSPPIPALRKKQKQKTVAMTQPTDQQALIQEEKSHSHRQQMILQELAELRKGLMTHSSDVDHKLGTLLNNRNYSIFN